MWIRHGYESCHICIMHELWVMLHVNTSRLRVMSHTHNSHGDVNSACVTWLIILVKYDMTHPTWQWSWAVRGTTHQSFRCVTCLTYMCAMTRSHVRHDPYVWHDSFHDSFVCFMSDSYVHCNTLQHTATHCNTLQHTATHCNTLQHTATHCNTLQHTTTHCNALQHTDIFHEWFLRDTTHFRVCDSSRVAMDVDSLCRNKYVYWCGDGFGRFVTWLL